MLKQMPQCSVNLYTFLLFRWGRFDWYLAGHKFPQILIYLAFLLALNRNIMQAILTRLHVINGWKAGACLKNLSLWKRFDSAGSSMDEAISKLMFSMFVWPSCTRRAAACQGKRRWGSGEYFRCKQRHASWADPRGWTCCRTKDGDFHWHSGKCMIINLRSFRLKPSRIIFPFPFILHLEYIYHSLSILLYYF